MPPLIPIILMVVFSLDEGLQRVNSSHDLGSLLGYLCYFGVGLFFLLVIEVKYGRFVLGADVLTLTIFLSGVVNSEEDVKKF